MQKPEPRHLHADRGKVYSLRLSRTRVGLADHGADFAAKDNFGRTPLEEAEFEAPASTIELTRKLAAERQSSLKQ
jgi:hypothetical protein